jgi:hypothetical protein
MAVFTFDITVSSHDLLRRGVVEARIPFSGSGDAARFHRVQVEADTWNEAELIAVEMVWLVVSRFNADVMVTGAYPVV